MKIAYLSTFHPYRGGIAQFNAALHKELIKKHDVSAFNFSRQYPDFLFPGKTQYVASDDIAYAMHSERILDSINPISWYKTAKAINATKPDLLLTRYWTSYMAPCLGTVTANVRSKAVKAMSIVDNALPHEKTFFDKAFAKYYLNRNDLFVAMSESVKEDIIMLKPDARILLREHPLYSHFGEIVDKAFALGKLNIPKGKKNILFFGFIREYKGLDILLEAFSHLDDSYQLIIAGENYGSFEKYQNLIDNLPNKHSVFPFIRYINDDEVPLFFASSDVVCLPYRSATQSGITAVSFHFEKPVIATNVGGLKETIQHGKTGIIAEYPSPELILNAIKDFYSLPADQWSRAISELKEKLSWEKFAEDLIEFAKS